MRDSRRQEDVDGIATELGVSSADLDKAINVDFNASSKAFYDFTHVPRVHPPSPHISNNIAVDRPSFMKLTGAAIPAHSLLSK